MSSEALRLADLFELEQDPESLYRQAASLLRTQAARIAELEAKLAEEDARTTRICGLLGSCMTERDQLLAEVERLRKPLTDEQIDCLKYYLSADRDYEEYTGRERLVVEGHLEFASAIEAAKEAK